MARILLHIGTPKTGTSALQSFLKKNRECLAASGNCYYQTLHRYNPWWGLSNADFLLHLVMRELGRSMESRYPAEIWAKLAPNLDQYLKEEAEAFRDCCRRYPNVILSEEWLWGFCVEFPDFPDALSRVLMRLAGEDASPEIMVYLRPQLEWVLSKWKEDMRNTLPVKLSFRQAVQKYDRDGSLDYNRACSTLEHAFGGRVIVRTYEPRFFEGGDIYHDFMAAAGLPWEEGLVLTNPQNLSISLTAADALLFINRHCPPRTQRKRELLNHSALSLSASFPNEKGACPLNEEEIRDLSGRFEENNRLLAERLLGRDELFRSGGVSYKPWTPSDLKRTIFLARLRIRFFLAKLWEFLRKVKRAIRQE